jgi:hypothetical protein
MAKDKSLRRDMLALSVGCAAWGLYTFVTTMGDPDRPVLGLMILGLAAVFFALRARRSV